MADIRYYVSQQNGSDSNTGLSVAQAWATLTKAASTVATPGVGDRHIVHFGPGTYREKISLSNSGRSATENIIYAPDPNCRRLTSDTPGRCRITGTNSSNVATAGNVWNFNDKSHVQLGTLDDVCVIDGSTDGRAVIRGGTASTTCIAVNIESQAARYGIAGILAVNCIATGGQVSFSYADTINCIALGGADGYQGGTHHNSLDIGSYNGFGVNTTTYNCIAIGCSRGFGSTGSTHYRGFAQSCSTAYLGTTTVYNCLYAACAAATSGTIGGDGSVTHTGVFLQDYLQALKLEPWMGANLNGIPYGGTPTTDILGRPRPSGVDAGSGLVPRIGPWETPNILNSADLIVRDIYQTAPPTIRIAGEGEVYFDVPAKGGEAVTVSWQARHQTSAAGNKPQIILRGLGITEQTATHTGSADTWQELSVSATPAVSGVLTCVLKGREKASGTHYAYFSDPSVS